MPSPNVAEDHQTKNAKSLSDKNAAAMVKDVEASEKLVQEAVAILKDDNRLKEIQENINRVEKHDSANEIAREILELVKK